MRSYFLKYFHTPAYYIFMFNMFSAGLNFGCSTTINNVTGYISLFFAGLTFATWVDDMIKTYDEEVTK